MAIQELLDGATSITMDKAVPTAMSISRGQQLRTQSRAISTYKFAIGLNPGYRYDNTNTRSLLTSYDVQGRIAEEQVKLSNVAGGAWIQEYQGNLSTSDQNLTYITSHTGSTFTVNVSNVVGGADTVLVEAGDFIQAANARYPYQATTTVTKGSGATVSIPVHRDIIETNTGANLLYGNDVTFRVKMIEQPPYSLTPGRYVEWGGEMQLMEVLTEPGPAVTVLTTSSSPATIQAPLSGTTTITLVQAP